LLAVIRPVVFYDSESGPSGKVMKALRKIFGPAKEKRGVENQHSRELINLCRDPRII
jgi:hypothetical protein